MAAFLGDISNFSKTNLKQVETLVKTRDGEVYIEKKNYDNTIIAEKQSTLECGWVIDLTPDLNMGILWDDKMYISSQDVPRNLDLLKQYNISHVLNLFSNICFHTDKIKHLSVRLYDTPEFGISEYFTTCFDFIDSALTTINGRILIHCNAGRSRSVTIGLAYMMKSQRTKWRDLLEYLKKSRPAASPNEGFIKQLDAYQRNLGLK